MTSDPAVPIIKIGRSMDVTGAGFELRFVCVLSPLGYVASGDESHRGRALQVGTSVGSDESVTDSSSDSRQSCREE